MSACRQCIPLDRRLPKKMEPPLAPKRDADATREIFPGRSSAEYVTAMICVAAPHVRVYLFRVGFRARFRVGLRVGV